MLQRKTIVVVAMAGLIVISACILTGSPSVVSEPSQDSSTVLQTQVAGVVASTEAAETSIANAISSTLAAMVTIIPEFTLTPSFTLSPSASPSQTLTLTQSVPMVSVSQETYCRTGPGDPYAILGTLPVGVQAEVVARTDFGDWIIKLPSKPSVTCWLWDYYATVTGDTSTLPKVTPIPSPTPAASFQVEYEYTCNSGPDYAVMFRVNNNGSVTWESNQVSATDHVTAATLTDNYDAFPYADATCGLISIDQNLEAGEIGYTGIGPFTNPAGHSFTATIRVCSQDGMAGTCLEKTINFTP
jgi:uncharacterized protein YgiM (DUF1202 family)